MVICIKLGKFGRVAKHLERNKKIYVTVGCAVATSVLFDPGTALADINSGGRAIHAKLCSVGKWVIVVKGTIDTIQSVMNGDFQTAKKMFFSYLLCFAVMLGLPWSLDQVEGVFKQ